MSPGLRIRRLDPSVPLPAYQADGASGRGVRGFGSTGVRCDGGCAPRPCYCAELRRGDGCLAAQEAAGATIGAAEWDGCGRAEIVAPEANTTARGGS